MFTFLNNTGKKITSCIGFYFVFFGDAPVENLGKVFDWKSFVTKKLDDTRETNIVYVTTLVAALHHVTFWLLLKPAVT